MDPMVSASAVPALDPDVLWIEVEGEVVAVQSRTQVVHLVSETGAMLWPFLNGEATIDALAADVADVFEIPHDRALADVAAFVDEMVRFELVLLLDDNALGAGR